MKRKNNSIVSEKIISEEEVSQDYELEDNFGNNYNNLNDETSEFNTEEYTSSDEEYQDDGEEDYIEPQKENIFKKFLFPIIVVILAIVIVALGIIVFNKIQENKVYEDKSATMVEAPDDPNMYVSTVPTEKPTVLPSPTTDVEDINDIENDSDKNISEILAELEQEDKETVEKKFEKDSLNEETLDLESEDASLSLEEVDSSNIKESYKDIAVYFTDGLNTFHTKDCSILNGKNKVKTTAYSALEDGYEECKECNPLRNKTLASLSAEDLNLLSQIEVYKTPSNTKYHKENCPIVKDIGTKITLKEAIENGLEPCIQCNPKTINNFKDDDSKKVINSNNTTNNTTNNSKTNNSNSGIVPIITPTSKSSSENKTGITVIKPSPISSVINVTSLNLFGNDNIKVGETTQLSFSFLPTNANVILTYSSSNPLVATVNGSGLVTGINKGVVTISLTAPNGLVAYKIIYVDGGISVPTVVPTTIPTTPVVPSSTLSNDFTLDLNNLGLTGVSQFIDPSEINLIDMESMNDWINFTKKVDSNSGALLVTSSSISLSEGGVTRIQLTKIDDTHWTIRIYDSLNSYLNRCVLKALCTKISSTPDTLYTSIYKDHEESEFIGERYRAIGDAYVQSMVSGGSTTYTIKDIKYEY